MVSHDIDVVITFDRGGVSGHKNHSSINNAFALLQLEKRYVMRDDTTPVRGRGIIEIIPPKACMDKPKAVNCAAVEAVGLGMWRLGSITEMILGWPLFP